PQGGRRTDHRGGIRAMKGFPKFKSPLVVRPKPKQFTYLLLVLIAYLLVQNVVFSRLPLFGIKTLFMPALVVAFVTCCVQSSASSPPSGS
ncbi:MAG: hypothetical protein J6D10_10600, partial [Clostridia bacterium]|nr:hypothetical protein [Clostridia bacterium]